MTADRALHEYKLAASRAATLIQEAIDDGVPPSRHYATLAELDRLMNATPEFTKEQVLQWEAEALAERRAKE